ncbi:MAG: hypothetical protein MUO53_05890, partial [Maribacter sp.]|nr:hypothetical protein [Maribacter sp.]
MENLSNLKKEIFHFSAEYCPTEVSEQAENIYERLFRYNANSADVLHLLGGMAYQAARFDIAIKLIKKAIENDPTKEEFYHDLGVAYYE